MQGPVSPEGDMEQGMIVRARSARSAGLLLIALAGLCCLAYARTMSLPLIADDYLQVLLGRQYGPVSGWHALALDPLYRCRATSILITHWTEQWFGMSVTVFNVTGLVLHVLNTWLLFGAGCWKRIGWRVSFVAAAFFAVYEGHQEAVIWYSALPELLLFFFGLACLLLWIRWLAAGAHGALRYIAALACFVLALLSKEPAVALVPLLALIAWVETRRLRVVLTVLPFAAIALIYVAGIFAGSNTNQHFQDGTFSLHAPVLVVWTNSLGRLLWVPGVVSLIALAIWRRDTRWLRILWPAMIWIALTLLPYCFLTYMPRIPSRHTYLASAGLGLLAAAAFLTLQDRTFFRRRWIAPAVAAVVIAGNCGYLWTRKQRQYEERAAPTELLIQFARQVNGPVHVHCFPYGFYDARLALEIGAGLSPSMVVEDPTPSPDVTNLFCLGDRDHKPIGKSLMAAAPDQPSGTPSSH